MPANSRPFRILLVHNFYGSSAPSGENLAFIAERDLLRSRGHEVGEFIRHSDEIRNRGIRGLLHGAVSNIWNPAAARSIRKQIQVFQPDIVHIHNTFPLISPSVFHVIAKRAACVLTLHNYRLYCAAAIPMRDGRICTDCIDRRSALPGLQHGCYRSSRAATLPLACSIALHRTLKTWMTSVHGYIALSDFQRSLMVRGGLPKERIHVKPNFCPKQLGTKEWSMRSPYIAFAGRLSSEKGIETLLRAWRLWGPSAPELRLVGDGPLRAALERIGTGLPVVFLGQKSVEDSRAQIAGSRLLVLPSECIEGFPMVIAEAFGSGTPIAVSDIGPLPSIVENGVSGVVFPAANPDALVKIVRQAWETQGMLARLARGASTVFESKYTEDANYEMLIGIYREAVSRVDVTRQVANK